MTLLTLLMQTARACTCNGVPENLPIEVLAPRPGEAEVPLNASVWVALRGADPANLDGFTLTSGPSGGEVPASWDRSALVGDSGLAALAPDAPFPEGVDITVNLGDVALLTFTTGHEADNAPPTWDGDSDRKKVHDHKICGEHSEVDWTLTGISESAMPDSLFLHLVPRGANAERWIAGTDVVLSWDEICGGNEPSMMEDFHRSYDAEVWDPSGNRSEAHKLRTGGCAVSGGPSEGRAPQMALAGLIALVAFRRTGSGRRDRQ
jgi:hypothetical protein